MYKPPKVKPNKNKKTKPLPEWNDSINNLDKFKLTSSESVKIILFLVEKENKLCFEKLRSSEKRLCGTIEASSISKYIK